MIYRAWKIIRICKICIPGIRRPVYGSKTETYAHLNFLRPESVWALMLSRGSTLQNHTLSNLNLNPPLVYPPSCKICKNMQNMQEYSKNAGILKTNQNTHHLSAFARKSVMSSSSFGGFRQQNKRYHYSGSSVTSISSGDESTKGTSMGCFKFQWFLLPHLWKCKKWSSNKNCNNMHEYA